MSESVDLELSDLPNPSVAAKIDEKSAPETDAVLNLSQFIDNDTKSEDLTAETALQMVQYDDDDEAKKNIQVVQYEPDEKLKRLGRPRNFASSLVANEDSSSENLERATFSKFRLDELPVDGPGSRGGTTPRREPKGMVSGKQKQKQLSISNFFQVDKAKPLAAAEKESNEPKTEKDSATEEKKEKQPEIVASKAESGPKEETTEPKPKPSLTPSKRPGSKSKSSTPVAKKPKTASRAKPRTLSSKVTHTSRTTVINNRHRVTRQLPGPLLPLYYDTYDDNILGASENQSSSNEKICLGFPIAKNSYAGDIVYVVSFLNKFKDILYLYNIGPQDIEEGLSLPPSTTEASSTYISKQETESNPEYNPEYVSPLMELLFCHLLTLILNRKKPIQPTSQTNAISELKTMLPLLGLPQEWRQDPVIVTVKVSQTDVEDPVDPNNSLVLQSEIYKHSTPSPITNKNPFLTSDFEKFGLKGIDPIDRLIMIRSFIQWSFLSSNTVKNYITHSAQSQEILGDKDTYYGPRSILKGFKNTDDVRKEAESKMSKRKSSTTNPEDSKYVDPTSDPLQHSMRLRLDELVVGDIGFHIGRFYFVRMADDTNGGLSSIDRMKYIWSNKSSEIAILPSQFKLYVLDVHTMLSESLADNGVEFDSNGNEVELKVKSSNSEYWYEVASTVTELEQFVHYLEQRLGVEEQHQNENEISKTSMIYRPLLNLRNYLSSMLHLLYRQDEVRLDSGKSRSSRRKDINYSDVDASRRMKSITNDEDDDIDQFDHDEDDAYEELEEIDHDDGEDEDYSE